MAIAQMAKVMIVSHRSQVSDLLEALQAEGICQILNVEEAMVSKDLPALEGAPQRPKDIEGLLGRLDKSIAFVKNYAQVPKGLAAALAPRTVVDEQSYSKIVSDRGIVGVVDRCELVEASMERTRAEIENLSVGLEALRPWEGLESAVEEITRLHRVSCWTGLIPVQQFDRAAERITELGGAIQVVGPAANKHACLIVCLNESADDVQKVLRSAEFEAVTFEGMTGTVVELIAEHREKLERAQRQLQEHQAQAGALGENLLNLEILSDHNQNLLNREQTRDTAPATEHTVLLEGWVKKKDYGGLEKIVSGFEASSLGKIEPAEGEQIPVEIENKHVVKPFEVITRLYGMPQHYNIDPTVFLAPFFALFFGLCLTDAGYGLVMVALIFLLVRKTQGDKKLLWMLGICAAATIVAGALTGGWFGDAVQQFVPALKPMREKMMWFDPFEKPMLFFGLSLALGYVQIMAGLMIAFVHNLRRKQYIAGLCDQFALLVMLNSVAILAASKFVALPASVPAWAPVLVDRIGKVCTITALVPAAVILLFSHRQGGWGARIGMGAYNLFSTIFIVGDVLSYIRLMALGMVTAGLAMAINVMARLALDIPYGIGVVAMILVLVGGHGFNIAINALGAFVHTLRLQYAEFFPKFLIGGGRAFEPLNKKYRHIYITKEI